MLNEMSFNVDCVRRFFGMCDFVFTVRRYKYEKNVCLVDNLVYKRVMIGIVERKEDLDEYLDGSGFRSVDDWWRMIKSFCKNDVKYMYLVYNPSSVKEEIDKENKNERCVK